MLLSALLITRSKDLFKEGYIRRGFYTSEQDNRLYRCDEYREPTIKRYFPQEK